jgi:hypothetical protein
MRRSTLSHDPSDALGNRYTNIDLDLVAWTEGLLQARHPTLMPPVTMKLVVALQMSGFASLVGQLTDSVIASLLLVGIWYPYFRRQDIAFLPTARSWRTRSL